MQLIITLDDKKPNISLENSSGNWKLFRNCAGQRDKIDEKFFSSEDMDEELQKVIDELIERNKS